MTGEKEKLYLNGRFVAPEKAMVSVFDRGFTYGDALFETMKAYNGRVFLLEEHLERLKAGAKTVNIPTDALSGIEGKLNELLTLNGLTGRDASVRITLSRGVDYGGYALPERTAAAPLPPPPTVLMTAKEVDTGLVALYREKGISAVSLRGRGPAVRGVKSTNFLPNILGKAEAHKRGAVEGIFTEEDGTLIEGTAANIFIVADGTIKTPPLGTGCLPGITRAAVIRLAEEGSVPVVEAPVSLDELRQSDEAFLTSSILEVVPLVEVDGGKIGNGRPGGITRAIQEAYGKKASGGRLDFKPRTA
ncbi:MAG: aminotransferase class IV [Thermodesulfobacteriota bacterium]